MYSKGDRIVYEPVRDLQKRPSQPKHVREIKPNPVLERQTSFSTTKALTLNDHYIAPDHWESVLRVFPDVRCLRSTSHLVEGSDASATSYTEWPELDMVQTLAPLPFHRCCIRRLELGRPLAHFHAPPEMQDFMRRVSPVALTSSLQDKRLNYVGQDLDRLRILRLNECVEPEFDNIVVSLTHAHIVRPALLIHPSCSSIGWRQLLRLCMFVLSS